MNERKEVPVHVGEKEAGSGPEALIRSVKETEAQLAKENKLFRLQIGTATVMTTCPEKYQHLK